MEDIYLYKGTNVLKNKANIMDQDKLDDYEVSVSILANNKLLEEGYNVISLEQIKDIHTILFNEVYEWAGEYRKINIVKREPVLNGLSVIYSSCNDIDKDIKKLDREFKKEVWTKLSKTQKLDKLIYYFSKLWRIHPFREGNTRTVITLLALFIGKIGLKINSLLLSKHSKFLRNALVMVSIDEKPEPEHIKAILGDALSFKQLNNNKYQTINGYKVEKYKYQPHTIKE